MATPKLVIVAADGGEIVQDIVPKELKDFSESQLAAIEQINSILEQNGLVNYGDIGLPNPRQNPK